ncbi:hypothetical protein FHX48_001481 [Microbacterium halimionae]|uniref:Uncharacterized protein n=1 Tax=Microbacterium halimionae TaxID=1526413 RepID=A0A7W3JPC6_9MICO|nr:hypothetical protein [Microbacterium halimionae]MBA8816408.1 hypothetical protein [Microbacterium halimionae]NII95406.1 hypothetical protein [Microbacterium halimionae]
MIFAGLTLLAVGAVDLVRQFVPRMRRGWVFAAGFVALLVLSAAVDALIFGMAAGAIAAVWHLSMPSAGGGRAGFWPVAGVGLVSVVSVMGFGARAEGGPWGRLWQLETPAGPASLDLVVLVVGVGIFLLESANVVVRAGLRSENAALGSTQDGSARDGVLRGGRLIGPLERILVVALALAGAYTLIAAVFAAKGIVRFPEISRDTAHGNRAEYFLVGSLLSWVLALASAFLVWWAYRTAL